MVNVKQCSSSEKITDSDLCVYDLSIKRAEEYEHAVLFFLLGDCNRVRFNAYLYF